MTVGICNEQLSGGVFINTERMVKTGIGGGPTITTENGGTRSSHCVNNPTSNHSNTVVCPIREIKLTAGG
jgi:hypothetical protein